MIKISLHLPIIYPSTYNFPQQLFLRFTQLEENWLEVMVAPKGEDVKINKEIKACLRQNEQTRCINTRYKIKSNYFLL